MSMLPELTAFIDGVKTEVADLDDDVHLMTFIIQIMERNRYNTVKEALDHINGEMARIASSFVDVRR